MHPEAIKSHSKPTSLGSINQIFLDMEVDLAVLSRELSELADMSGRIGDSCRDLRLLLQEQDYVQAAQDLI